MRFRLPLENLVLIATAIAFPAITRPSCAQRAAQRATQRAAQQRPALSNTDIDDIAHLELLEDRRQLDTVTLRRLLTAPHPEVRRRAVLAVARITDKGGLALLRAMPPDADTAVAATVVFAVGQLRDTSTVRWLDSLLSDPRSAPTVATEAAAGLGKIRAAAARSALAAYLSSAVATARTTPTIGEALLSIGRSTARGDLAPILRWTASRNTELRWRATWALFRPRDPAAVGALLVMSKDSSALVRSWAVRGLSKPQADSSASTAAAESRLLAAARDRDRRVRTEALRALSTYTDSTAIKTLVAALSSNDSWISTTAADGLGRVRDTGTNASLSAVTGAAHSCALRLTAMQALQTFAPRQSLIAAASIARGPAGYCRASALAVLARDTSRSIAERRADLSSADAAVRLAALRAMATWADTTDLPFLLDLYDRTRGNPTVAVASAAATAVAGVQRRYGAGASVFFARFTAPVNQALRRDVGRAFGAAAQHAWPPAEPPQRSLAEYRAIVERWVVPDYEGRPRPTAEWETPRGRIVLELYPGDAPLATDDFVKTVESGALVGTEFTRVVPDFVDQQRTIRDGNVLRDEVNRHRLTRGNLAWATAGLDTGSPGYTLNHTPQPHNEGDFTSLGRVVMGMDAVDRIELGDAVTAARMVSGMSKR